MSKQNIILVAGGPTENLIDLADLASKLTGDENIWVGVDRGNIRLMDAGIAPNISVGDFDSLSKSEREKLYATVADIHSSVPEKDATDTELALQIVADRFIDADQIYLCGATGGRLDHFLSNFWIAFRPDFQNILPKIVLLDKQNSIRYFTSGTYEITKEVDKKYLAFVCMTPVEKLTLRQVKYVLTDEVVAYPISYASNEFLNEEKPAIFSFARGLMAVIQSCDV